MYICIYIYVRFKQADTYIYIYTHKIRRTYHTYMYIYISVDTHLHIAILIHIQYILIYKAQCENTYLHVSIYWNSLAQLVRCCREFPRVRPPMRRERFGSSVELWEVG